MNKILLYHEFMIRKRHFFIVGNIQSQIESQFFEVTSGTDGFYELPRFSSIVAHTQLKLSVKLFEAHKKRLADCSKDRKCLAGAQRVN